MYVEKGMEKIGIIVKLLLTLKFENKDARDFIDN
jgi:hypothetical protein